MNTNNFNKISINLHTDFYSKQLLVLFKVTVAFLVVDSCVI